MKKLDRYIGGSVIRLIIISSLLITLVLALFDIFSNLEQYISANLRYGDIGLLTLLFIPQALNLALGPATLFSTTYFLSMLHANNEMIILSNIGHSFRRIVRPIFILGIFLVAFQFGFSEKVAIPTLREKQILTDQKLGRHSSYDSRNITLQSPDGNYILHAKRYREEGSSISSVLLIILDDDNRLASRIDAASGHYNGEYWVLNDIQRYNIDSDNNLLLVEKSDVYHNPTISIEPALFRNLTADISTMELEGALRYVQVIKKMNATQYAVYASDLASRIWTNLTPLILIFISSATLFAWRKNVLILSILSSLSIAVIYFVFDMVSMIFAKQGIISPNMGPLLPMIVLSGISLIILIFRRT